MTKREQEASDMMKNIMRDIEKKLPKDMGFTLLAYEFGNKPEGRRLLYASNSKREDVVKVMLEFVEKHLTTPSMYGKDV